MHVNNAKIYACNVHLIFFVLSAKMAYQYLMESAIKPVPKRLSILLMESVGLVTLFSAISVINNSVSNVTLVSSLLVLVNSASIAVEPSRNMILKRWNV